MEEKLLDINNILGTDHLGREIFPRLVEGTQVTFFTSLLIVVISAIFGMVLGVLAGSSRGWLDEFITRVTDLVDSFPSIIVVLIMVSILGSGVIPLGISLFLVGWTNYSRVARVLTKELMSKEFVLSSKLLGKAEFEIVFKDILPNIFPQILIVAFNNFAGVILSLASYSFLGFGVKPPGAELGMMINEGRDYIYSRPEMMIAPGVTIFTLVLVINILGRGLKNRYEKSKD